ncbi:MAG TPA: NAD-dependent deacylase [Chitinophagales bacterium]|nr:NAD-dependent deacylase [Chitinophagales bacterium]
MKIVALTGAGISAESGIPTFRGAGGLWEGHRIEDVASPDGWYRDRSLVLRFYNERRKGIKLAKPNRGHVALAELEKQHQLHIITQNIDDLHERAGASNILHLHGEIFKARSERNAHITVKQEDDINLGDLATDGAQLRPHIVWFGEEVPMMEPAIQIVQTADILLIIGTSMVVYPAASLMHYTKTGIPVFVIDPNIPAITKQSNIHFIQEPAGTGVDTFIREFLPIYL